MPGQPIGQRDFLGEIRSLGDDRTLIVLDDDPTGTQTVRDLDVLTEWTAAGLGRRLGHSRDPFFVLTNSRSLSAPAAIERAWAVGTAIAAAEGATGRLTTVVSRSDSTLRGHFPGEVDALAHALGRPEARIVLAPFFGDGGRVTTGDTHWLRVAGELLPVGQSEFAADPTFAYRSSNLRDWIVEKGAGDRAVTSVSLEELREGPRAVVEALTALPAAGILIVNAETERDIETAALGVIQAESRGVPLVARTAASYVRARAGQPPHPLLPAWDLGAGGPGLVIVGSHVPTSTEQLTELMAAGGSIDLALVELDARTTTDVGPAARRTERSAADAVDAAVRRGTVPVLATSRQLVRGDGHQPDLAVAATVSEALVRIVQAMTSLPKWVIAKGGITSSDIATRALDVRRAKVLGQILPGVPVWRLGSDARWPGIPYVVYPGNVGPADGLRRAVIALTER
jgi:uncharacterized protein YgbK (DUF1537 family)